MGINSGNNKIKGITFGSIKIKQVYEGTGTGIGVNLIFDRVLLPPTSTGSSTTFNSVTVTIQNNNPVAVQYEADLSQADYGEDVVISANSSKSFTFTSVASSTSHTLNHRFNPTNSNPE